MHMPDISSLEHATKWIFGLIGVLTALKHLVKHVSSWPKLLPRHQVIALTQTLHQLCVRAIALASGALAHPRPRPWLDITSKVVFTALLYVLALDCLALFVVGGMMNISANVPWTRHVAGALVIAGVAVCGRLCCVSADKDRLRLSANSRRLW
jgi:hypothetical protein